MRSRSTAPLSTLAAGATLVALGLTTACSSPAPARTTASATGGSTTTSSATSGPPSLTTTTRATTTMTTTMPSSRLVAPKTGHAVGLSCGQRLAAAMTPAQRAGQLLMVGLKPTMSSRAVAAQVRSQGLGSVIYLGGWSGGSASVATVSARLQAAAGGDLLIAADQEGGLVQQLSGPGFARIPSARAQATTGTGTEQSNVQRWSRELARAGVSVNLAPVADTVPTSLGTANQPVGHHERDFAPGDPSTNARYAAAFVRGSLDGGIAPTVKHFPGLGRVTGNTDLTTSGITDRQASVTDPYLRPFAAGIAAGAPLVMVSSAFYPRLDPANQAMFSRAVVSGLLRQRLRFRGVVVTDDVGLAKAVTGVPVGQRATRFVAAGGDIVLTAVASQATVMLQAIAARRATSPAFGAQVDAAAARVLDLKARLHLVRCA